MLLSALALFSVSYPRAVAAQSCPPNSNVVTVTVTVADGSTPLEGPTVCPNPQNWPQGCYSGAWGSPIQVPLIYAGTYTFRGSSNKYLQATGGSATCTNVDGCIQCGGGGSFGLYASEGSIGGTVYNPETRGPAPGAWVYRSVSPVLNVQADQNGHYEFRATSEPARSNNWGLTVSGDGSGPGIGQYELTVTEWENRVGATTTSSQMANVDLFFNASEQPEKRMCPFPPGPDGRRPCDSGGRPVNFATGNVWFDQTDASIPGAGTVLRFDRSYNSDNAFRAIAGAFGRGWTHSYESSLSLTGVVLKLRKGDGTILFFEDRDGDSTFEPSLPLTERSWVVQAGSTFTRNFRAGGSETYDSAGRLTSIVSPAGQTTNVIRDGTGRLTSIAVPGGRSVTFDYEGSGKVSGLYGPEGVIASYEYDPAGMLRTVRYPDGTGYVFTYGGSGEVLTVADLTGTVIETHAYANGKGITSEIANGVEKLTFAYNGPQTVVTDALGNATTYDFVRIRAMRYIAKISGPCPSCGGGAGTQPQEWTYDSAGRVMSYKDAAGTLTTYTYNGSGDLTGETSPAGTVTYTYDPQGRVLTRAAPATGTVTYVHGPAGPTTVTEQVTATESRTTAIYYNAAGQPDTITDPRNKTTALAYNSSGDLTSVTDPLSHATTFGYDAMGRRTTVTTALSHTTTTVYDTRGRVTRITAPDNTYTEFAYDGSGQRKSVTDPSGRVTRYLYDAYGRLESVVDPLEGVTRYGYDLMSNLTSLTDAEGRVTSFEYDAFARVKKVIYPGGAFETFAYDAAGRLATRTDRKAVTTTYSYDSLSRLTGKTYSDGTTPAVSYTYDAAGRLLTAANGTDTLTWTYDLAGQVLTEASTKNASTVGYSYDLAGNRLTVGLDGQVFVTYGYDDASRLTSITRGSNVFGFAYDNANRRTSLTYPSGVTTAYTYDNLSRLTNLAATLSSTTITQWGYTYDPAGNRTQKTSPEYTEDYGYDAVSRLTEVNRTGSAGAKRWIHGYDRVGNRIREQIDNNVSTPAYNEKNQLLSSTVGGLLRFKGTLDEPGTVTVNGQPARMLGGNAFEATITATPGVNTVPVVATDPSGNVRTINYQVTVSGTTASYSYDPNGNLTSKIEGNDTWTYEWDAENRLKRVLKNAAEVARFAYDPISRRIEKVATAGTTSWTYDGEDIVREITGVTTLKYIHSRGIDEPLAHEDGSSLSFFHADGLGSIVKTTNAAGVVTASRRYDSFGNLELGAVNGYAYTGREWDSESGLAYYRARFYDPQTGRFLSEDPLRYVDGPNLYAYVSANPTNRIDPYGLQQTLRCTSATDILWGVVFHQYVCVESGSGRVCQGLVPTTSWNWGPGATDAYDSPQSACTAVSDNPCVAACVLEEFEQPPPNYTWPGYFPGTDAKNCFTYASTMIAKCFLQCRTQTTPTPAPAPPPYTPATGGGQ